MDFNKFIPELSVKDINISKQFYIDIIGFKLEYERKENKFIFISLEGTQIMLEQIHDDGWNVAELEYPLGRGVNFSIEVSEIDKLYNKFIKNNYPIYRPLMTNKYEVDGECVEQKEFLIQDPDGYLFRFTHQ